MPQKISILLQFRSISPIKELVLPDFVVITGLNGSGKSQLLEALTTNINGHVPTIEDSASPGINIDLKHRKRVTHANLAPNNAGMTTIEQARSNALNCYNEYKKYYEQARVSSSAQLSSFVKDKHWIGVIQGIAERTGKDVHDLSVNDFYDHYPIDDGKSVNDVFNQAFSLFFKRYHVKREDNRYAQYRHEKFGESSPLTEQEFIDRWGPPPWDLVNSVLEEANVDYRVNSPDDLPRDAPFELRLINNVSGAQINFSDLSSGEKVLISLALSSYNIHQEVAFPHVLLMDEPDAPLHPAMSLTFLRVLKKQRGQYP